MIQSEIEFVRELPHLQRAEEFQRESGFLSDQIVKGLGGDPRRDTFKSDWLARHAIEECGARDPIQMLNFVMNLSDRAKQMFPRYATLDACYKLSRLLRAEEDLLEAHR